MNKTRCPPLHQGPSNAKAKPYHRKTISLPALKKEGGLNLVNKLKKPNIKPQTVAKSDNDNVTYSKICFCSIKNSKYCNDGFNNQKLNGISHSKSKSASTLKLQSNADFFEPQKLDIDFRKDDSKQQFHNISNENFNFNLKDFDNNRPNEFISLFNEKCHQCENVFDITEKNAKNRENKNKVVSQLIKSLTFPTLVRKITKNEVEAAISVFSTNIFREYPPISSFPPSILFDRIESFHDEAWPQFELIFIFLLKIITATHIDSKTLNLAVPSEFVKKLFSCFASPDDRERKATVDLVYSIACRLPDMCGNIFSHIKNALFKSINCEPVYKLSNPQNHKGKITSKFNSCSNIHNYSNFWNTRQVYQFRDNYGNFTEDIRNDDDQKNQFYKNYDYYGIPQILELMSKMAVSIPQFSFIKMDSVILIEPFMCLHELNSFGSFQQQLFTCVEMILTLNNHYVDSFMLFLVNHFPIASQKKQILFLNEIECIVSKFFTFISPYSTLRLLTLISSLFSCPCVDISVKSFSCLFESGFTFLINQFYSQIAPVLFFKAKHAAKHHWDESVRVLSVAFLQELSKMNPNLFNNIISNKDNLSSCHKNEIVKANWDLIKEMAQMNEKPQLFEQNEKKKMK
ncbi:hypothetical protein TRFO_34913 [Tritrichomonas foetus]|uniref:Phosphoprotein phosphatase n=1 Tax=Tritrichomonas foetus TaxID=1144522 RepID=A0A1J4JM81_9EUKA|nr:hypothetical protein TRFO_34913 [Tritrichomonas foetus]|eukprot:OHS98637.1 hypothetical protein TRFO_34913 [Tritrichomonas foetus]